MQQNRYRSTLVFFCLGLSFVAGIVYDTPLVKTNERLAMPMVAIVAASLATAFLFQQYPVRVIQPVILATWPLHLFTFVFLAVCLAFHDGSRLHHVLVYTLVAYGTYVFVPLVLLLDFRLFRGFVKMIAILSALLAIPSLFGALGYESLFGIPIRIKPSYSTFSGIIASGGVFEHAEGHALQMATGLLCCLYAWRVSGSVGYLPCLLLILAGLVVSQGRAAIQGVAIAITFSMLPELFYRSRLVFLGTFLLILTLPFFLWTQLSNIPGFAGYLRLERGMSGRDQAWRYAHSLIAEKPWTGHGFQASTELTEARAKWLRRIGFSGAGSTFHNTFISKAVDLGVPATLAYSLLYIVPLLRTCAPSKYPREQELVRSVILLTVTTALFRDYNIGGVRSTVMMGAIFLGVANLWQLVAFWCPALPIAASREPDQRPVPFSRPMQRFSQPLL
jgi:O-antigen ligase